MLYDPLYCLLSDADHIIYLLSDITIAYHYSNASALNVIRIMGDRETPFRSRFD
jgi:hypothetical protein